MGTSYGWCLVTIDQSCGELAGLINSKGAVEEFALSLRQRFPAFIKRRAL